MNAKRIPLPIGPYAQSHVDPYDSVYLLIPRFFFVLTSA